MGSPSLPLSAGMFWAIVIGFLLGVAARSCQSAGVWVALFLAALSLGTLLLAYLDRTRSRQGIMLAAALLSCALGIVRMDAATLSGDPTLTHYLDRVVTIEGVVSAEPDVRDNAVRVAVDTKKIISPVRENVHAGVLVILPAHAGVHYGDEIHAWGTLRAPEAFDTSAGRQFNYPQYLASQGIEYELSLAQGEVVQNSAWQGNMLMAGAIEVKETFERGVQAALPEPEAGLANGITVGDKRGVGQNLTQTFQNVGLVHMVVLSGYNITVVLNAAEWSLVHLGAPRLLQYGASGFLVAFFILMSGGAASASRAGIMALVAVLARATHRRFLASRALALAALCIVVWNPFELGFDPSFQLSALATLGLVVFTPLVSARMRWLPEKFALREIASSTLGTQLAVLPLILYQNGLFPLYSLPANLFALVAVPPAMAFSALAALFGTLLGHLAVPLSLPAFALLGYIIAVARLFASLPYATLALPAFGGVWLFVAYAILFAGAWMFHKKEAAGS